MPFMVKEGEYMTNPTGAVNLPAGTPDPLSPAAKAGAPGTGGTPDGKTVPITALHEERDKRQALQAQLNNMNAALASKGIEVEFDASGNVVVKNPDPDPAPAGTGTPLNNGMTREQLEAMWETDPKAAMRAELMTGLTWLDGVNMQLRLVEAEFAKKHPDYAQHQTEILKYLAKVSPAQRADPSIIQVAYNAVRGSSSNLDALIEAKVQEKLALMGKGNSAHAAAGIPFGGSSGSGSGAAGDVGKLTTDQIAVAAAMGMSPEEYAKYVR